MILCLWQLIRKDFLPRMHNDVPLKEEIFGKNFLQCYMYALDSKIKELQKEFDEL